MTSSGIFIVNFEQILHLVLLFVLLRQVNARYGWLLLRHFSCVSFIYVHVQQKQLSSHTKQVALMVVVVLDAGGKNSIGMNSFYDFHQSSL